MSGNVLIVDDDPLIRETLTDFLCDDYHVKAVESAEEALPLAPDFDLIIVDYQLPGMNGLDLAHRMMESAPALKSILISGGIPPGLDLPFLAKPFGLADLLLLISQTLQLMA